jgi:hypothetical protein
VNDGIVRDPESNDENGMQSKLNNSVLNEMKD